MVVARSAFWAGSLIAAIVASASCTVIPQAATASTKAAPAKAIPPKPAPQPARPLVVAASYDAASSDRVRNVRNDLRLSGKLIQGGVMLGNVPADATALHLDGVKVPFDDDGKFIIAFNRDAGASANLVATLRGGSKISKKLAIRKRSWKIEHVNIARRRSGPSAAFQKIRAPEIAQINAARRVRSDSKGWSQSFVWPVKGRISGMFGSQRVYRGEPGSYHSGIDIATGKSGTPIVAPADGVVILAAAKPFSLEGNLLMIDHGMGLNSAFLHLSRINVANGQTVKRGQMIGRIGSTGRATGPHLHWSMKWNRARIDPILLTGPME